MKQRIKLNRTLFIGSLMVLLAGFMGAAGLAGEPHGRAKPSIEALSLVLELSSEQVKHANAVLTAGETAKQELRTKMRDYFRRLNEMVRTESPNESEVKALCHEIAGLLEQITFRDAQTQIAFRKIIDSQQINKLNRLEQLDAGVSGFGWSRGRSNWDREKGKND
ncbi:MAG: periplasmic heavy metal sensor [Acidobacteria bacterium]|nr:periplasmic heavy metal sensor [Acidobacteriota bacterium]